MTDDGGMAQALSLLAEALMTEREAVSAQARLGIDERWDSLAHLRLMLALEARLARTLSPEEIAAIESAEDVARLLA